MKEFIRVLSVGLYSVILMLAILATTYIRHDSIYS
jgi:hypothetical protein